MRLEELWLNIYQLNREPGWAEVKRQLLHVPHLGVTTKYMLIHTLLASVMCKHYLSYSSSLTYEVNASLSKPGNKGIGSLPELPRQDEITGSKSQLFSLAKCSIFNNGVGTHFQMKSTWKAVCFKYGFSQDWRELPLLLWQCWEWVGQLTGQDETVSPGSRVRLAKAVSERVSPSFMFSLPNANFYPSTSHHVMRYEALFRHTAQPSTSCL